MKKKNNNVVLSIHQSIYTSIPALKLFSGKTVLVTGHTGFKGTWLCLWLEMLGAKVIGYSIDIPTKPSLFELVKPKCTDIRADIKDFNRLNSVIKKYKPEIIFHLAAQPLVRLSYKETLDTYQSNVIGTANVFESLKKNKFVKAVVAITTDKVYLNNETGKAFKEEDSLGGYDPYSASKACCEIVISSYRNSFFNLDDYKKTHNTLIASVRAGNVIGGGDFAKDRLIPDFIRAILSGKNLVIRNPKAIRPWQHVLEPLSAYLLLGAKLLQGKKEFAQGWNFGPDKKDIKTVEEIVKQLSENFSNIKYMIDKTKQPHEAHYLKLDISKAKKELNWTPRWTINIALDKICQWTKAYKNKENIREVCIKQIEDFCNTKI
ncbi:CDP-glucose 4,6-dehydratase [Candidatus Ruminimicrobium bovinum]|uniref:CDP-glucose 4,6-dehydratase n=1 Tax=Candidatus Ruminimicrobium bovinum TaxID=3242779 RepID=UPI0039B878C3